MGEWVADVIEALGAFGVAVLIALENIFPPIPSEAVLPLAGYVASEGRLWWPGLVVAATIGSTVGAWVLYGMAAAVGVDRLHSLVRRYGRWVGVDEGELERAEKWFERRGTSAVILGRCVPLVRSLVSLPAGAARMPLGRFTVLTAIGSAVWNATLIGGGYFLGEQWRRVGDVVGWLTWVVLGAAVVALVLYARKRLYQRLDRQRVS